MSTQNAVAVLIYDQIGGILKDFFDNGDFSNLLSPMESLLHQLENGPENEPPEVTFGLLIDFVGNSVSSSLDHLAKPFTTTFPLLPLPFFSISSELLKQLRALFDKNIRFFGTKMDALVTMITATNADARKSASKDLFTDSTFFSEGLQKLIGDEIGAVLSLATIGNALQESPLNNVGQVPVSVEKALRDYFFNKKGYQTVDGSNIVSPVHLSDIVSAVAGGATSTSGSPDLAQFKSLFSKATAEHYVRDTIRVTVEAAYDTSRDLRKAYKDTRDKLRELKDTAALKDAIGNKFVTWFRGFSAVAESAAMRTVETATEGVSGFQTNTLIAAAAGTFAGTIARKLAQDDFLEVLYSDFKDKDIILPARKI
jgi:hypothetical protein